MMQRLAEDRKVHRGVIDRWTLQVTLPKIEVRQAVFLCLGLTELDDLIRVVDSNYLTAFSREQLAEQPFTGAEVGHDDFRQQPQEQLAKRLPRAARAVDAVEPAGHAVEVNEILIFPAFENPLQVLEIRLVLGNLGSPGGGQLNQSHVFVAAGHAIVGVLAVATRLNQPGVL